jgi:hypothetical protein
MTAAPYFHPQAVRLARNRYAFLRRAALALVITGAIGITSSPLSAQDGRTVSLALRDRSDVLEDIARSPRWLRIRNHFCPSGQPRWRRVCMLKILQDSLIDTFSDKTKMEQMF